jgi:hypothetical protein
MVAPASVAVVTLSGGALTAMLKFADLVTAVGVCESVTVKVKVEVPVNVPVGVPERTPVVVFKFRPAGRLPDVTAHL